MNGILPPMTALIDLRAQLNIIDDTDDALLAGKIAAAEAHTTNVTGAQTPVTYDDAPADMRQAILMLAAHWFENREATIAGMRADPVPFGFDELIASHRAWVF